MPDEVPFLNTLADALCQEVAGGGPNRLVHLKEAGDGYDVGLLPLDGARPASLLLGTVAPPEWIALGVATRGRPHDLGGDRRRKLPASAACAVIVHRDGTVLGRFQMGEVAHSDPPAYGLTLDCLQRALGLPTAPPQASTGARFTSLWLEKVQLAAQLLPAGKLTWKVIVALHPAVDIGDEAAAGMASDLAATVAMERACDWERLRWLVVEGRWHEPYVTPVDAAWLDAGSFSRLVMADVTPIHIQLAELRRTAGAAIARRCRTVAHRLGYRAGRAAA